MDFYTRNWYYYIYDNYKDYVINWISYFDAKKVNSSTIFTEEILIESFEKYYNAKKEYVSNYDYYAKEFGKYEKIELLDYNTELNNYRNRLNEFVKSTLSKIKDNCKYEKLENDLMLYGCKYITTKFGNEILKSNRITCSIDKFLTSYEEYIATKKVDKVFNNIEGFHDGSILDYQRNDKDISFTVSSEWSEYEYTFNIKNPQYTSNSKDFEKVFKKIIENDFWQIIYHMDCLYLEDKKYLLRIELADTNNTFIEMWSDNIEVKVKKMKK